MDRFITLTASGLTQASIIALIALGFLVIYKATGVINFAQGDLVTLGAYVAFAAYQDFRLSLWTSYAVAIAAMFVVGVVLELLVHAPLRGRSVHVVVIATLGAALVIRSLIVLWQGNQPKRLPGPFGFDIVEIGGARIPMQSLLIVGATGITVCLVALLFSRTQFGRQVRAVASDRTTARLHGIPVARLSMIAFGLGALLSGIAGVLVAPTQALTPSLGFGPMLFSFAAAILGGFGRIGGVVVGALVIGLSQQWLAGYVSPNLADIYPFAIMLAVIAIKPSGLFGSEVGERV